MYDLARICKANETQFAAQLCLSLASRQMRGYR